MYIHMIYRERETPRRSHSAVGEGAPQEGSGADLERQA